MVNNKSKCRSFYYSSFLMCIHAASVAAYYDDDEEKFSKRSFPECQEQNLSPEECKALIEEQIESGGGHQVENVKVVIQKERSPDELKDSYWMVEVPSTIDGHPGWCDKEDGTSFYPFDWEILDEEGKETTVPVEGVGDCLTAVDCCLKIREYGKTLSPSGYDKNGHCLSCFIHRDTLVPLHVVHPYYNDEVTRYLGLMASPDNNSTCEIGIVQDLLSPISDVLSEADRKSENQVADALSDLSAFFDPDDNYPEYYNTNVDGALLCEEFNGPLLESLYSAAVHVAPLSQKIGQLACMVCYGGDNDRDDIFNDDDVQKLVEEIKTLMERSLNQDGSEDDKLRIKSYLDNDIVIYATNTNNEDGSSHKIKTVPQLGGLRADYFLQRDDLVEARHQCYYFVIDEPYGGVLKITSGCNQITEYCFSDGVYSKCLPKRCDEKEHQCKDDEVCNIRVYRDYPFDNYNNDRYVPKCVKSCISDPTICSSSFQQTRQVCDAEHTGSCTKSGYCVYDPSLCNEDQFCMYFSSYYNYYPFSDGISGGHRRRQLIHQHQNDEELRHLDDNYDYDLSSEAFFAYFCQERQAVGADCETQDDCAQGLLCVITGEKYDDVLLENVNATTCEIPCFSDDICFDGQECKSSYYKHRFGYFDEDYVCRSIIP